VDRLLLVLVGLALAAAIAFVVLRKGAAARQPATATGADGPERYPVPTLVSRDDFPEPQSPWLVAVFTSSTCDSCARTWASASQLAGGPVAVAEVTVQEHPDVHERYRIEAVPIIVVADADGVVRASFVGPPTATDLWGTVAELREPGSLPDGCDHGQQEG
jgi:hypothetical protein